jgi:hypothetical protein
MSKRIHIDNTPHATVYELEALTQRGEPGRRKTEYHWVVRRTGTLAEMEGEHQKIYS